MKTKFLLFSLFFLAAMQVKANNMLVNNVTTTGNNATNKTIQVKFDMSWDNSWRDGINWDAAWVFMKYKDANGNWQHVQLNTTGFVNGTGTANTIKVGSDKVGAFVYRSAVGTGTFTSTSMQLQWNYGLSGLTSVTGLEIRVFAVEMVYVPQGDFNCALDCYVKSSGIFSQQFSSAPGGNFIVINDRLSPILTFSGPLGNLNIRIKGDVGIDNNIDGIIDNSSYVTGFQAFYSFKYELSEGQYADFINTLTSTQINNLGIPVTSITIFNGVYYSSNPNRACGGATGENLLAFADWSGLRPISYFEFNKLMYGPIQPKLATAGSGRGWPAWGTGYIRQANSYPNTGNGNEAISSGNCAAPGGVNSGLYRVGIFAKSNAVRQDSGAGYFGALDLTGNSSEPIMPIDNINFSRFINGNGILSSSGLTDQGSWSNSIHWVEQWRNFFNSDVQYRGFRYVRSAE